MGEDRQTIRERAFLFWGAVMGAVLGIFGNLFTSYFYDIYKSTWWMPYAGWGSYAFVVIILIILTVYMQRWLRQAR